MTGSGKKGEEEKEEESISNDFFPISEFDREILRLRERERVTSTRGRNFALFFNQFPFGERNSDRDIESEGKKVEVNIHDQTFVAFSMADRFQYWREGKKRSRFDIFVHSFVRISN